MNEDSASTRAVYNYPKVSEIIRQQVVKSQMDEAWRLMKKCKFSFSC